MADNSYSPLNTQQCEACNVNAPKVTDDELAMLIREIPDWVPIVEENIMKLAREFNFKNYKQAWDFANKISALAEQEFHHPTIVLEWGKVTVTLWSHKAKGLHKNDFICAAKSDALLSE